ncbi:hypothetical protein FRC03_010283 [Tulasnella sp. 419]|nr:hypothetical protein FRC02_011247 [Tulasnella sp. 418]KAG8957300.1 hypothetical protein FRC03_010283 [Tulasnella sp. 419]
MPRLFTSHRAAPSTVRARPLVALNSSGPPLLKRKLSPSPETAVTAPLPAPATVVSTRPVEPPMLAGTVPLVLVPPVPASLARLMDSHDLDNPYLVAAFNVLITNDNNPMRVPDILHAVQKRGWTQVLHRHKDRPEQLFGNALRAHQRRREMLNKPSLVFMIDAGSCWKHHEIDLSAASGRRKGKIWCFTKDAGYPCPYARLGWDLKTIVAAQQASSDISSPKSQNKESDSSSQDGSRKRRKVEMSGEVSVRFEAAVRGAMASVHPVANAPPPHIPAAIPRSVQYNSLLSNPVRTPAPPLEIIPRATASSSVSMDLDQLIPLSPHSSCAELDREEPQTEDSDPCHDLGTQHTEQSAPPVVEDSSLVKLEDVYASDDDEDDFHVTMRDFSLPEIQDEASAVVKIEPDLERDSDSDCSVLSSIRTPTPPLSREHPLDISLLLNDVPFHGSQYEDSVFGEWTPNWSSTWPSENNSLDDSPLDESVGKAWLSPDQLHHLDSNVSFDFAQVVVPRSREASVSSEFSAPSSTPSRANSIFSTSSSSASSHPLILYSPSLAPSMVHDHDKPFKSGLTHNYLAVDVGRGACGFSPMNNGEMKELEAMLDWDAHSDRSASVTL